MDGILVINKPCGMTSFDVIAKLRKKYKQKKFGHTGTLDPNASGVLVVLCGRATKALQFLENSDKTYIAQMKLGQSTTTDDIWGEIEQEKPVVPIADLQAVLDTFVGKQSQLVPKTSAKKIAGKKLYEYQRAGKEVPEVYAVLKRHLHPFDLPGHRAENRQCRNDDRSAAHRSRRLYDRTGRRARRARTYPLSARKRL